MQAESVVLGGCQTFAPIAAAIAQRGAPAPGAFAGKKSVLPFTANF
jgi:hypothetical protein